MLVSNAKDNDSSADYRILNYFETIYKVLGLTTVNAGSEMSEKDKANTGIPAPVS